MVKWQCSGSGIYSSGEILTTFYNPSSSPENRLLIADVPILSSVKRQNPNTNALKNNLVKQISVRYLDVKPGYSGKATASVDDVDCSLEYKISSIQNKNESYALVALSGNTFSQFFPVSCCTMVLCTSSEDCIGQNNFVLATTVTFDFISLNATYKDIGLTVLPITSETEAQLLPVSLFNWNENVVNGAWTAGFSSSNGLNKKILDFSLVGLDYRLSNEATLS
eukprot:TRINITY_DN2841_c0_g1_i7.p1 TRINITY_DN2841_c0_g1~~TRINITY_DN2841_c0_g1_i7.p1  ORF type:complete len:223 (-),score=38.50 TRINITY_DN2841_c0_g1_i7:40-708(-)